MPLVDKFATQPGGNDWKSDNQWTLRHLQEARRLMGPFFLPIANRYYDQHCATDFMVRRKPDEEFGAVLAVRDGKQQIACRIRRALDLSGNLSYRMLEYFKTDFSIRSRRNSCEETELQKVLEGFGSYYFYGLADAVRILRWKLVDLAVFRATWADRIRRDQKPLGYEKPNTDNETWARYIPWAAFPKDFILDQGEVDIEQSKKKPLTVMPKGAEEPVPPPAARIPRLYGIAQKLPFED